MKGDFLSDGPRNDANLGTPVPILYGPGAEEALRRQMETLDNAPRVHECRSWSHLFQPIIDGVKTHDLRIDDRNYRVGDLIHLREYDIAKGEYTGREAMVQITYITGRGEGQNPCAFSSAVLQRDYVILSIRLLETQ